MSFFLTTPQFLDGSKDVTRRLGWWFLKPGDRVMAVRKGQGLKKGEKIERLGEIEIVDSRPEALFRITQEEVHREGFPGRPTHWFIEHFCKNMKCTVMKVLNRIEFKRIKENQ